MKFEKFFRMVFLQNTSFTLYNYWLQCRLHERPEIDFKKKRSNFHISVIYAEAVGQRCSVKSVFLEILCERFFFNKVDSGTGVFQ